MTRAKAEKIIKGIDNKIRKATVDMEWWADFWGFTVDEYEEFLNMAVEALAAEPSESCCDKAPKNYDVDKCPYQKKNCIMQCLRDKENKNE